MKIKSLLFSLLCVLAISFSYTSCSSNDDDDLIDSGSTLNLPRTRAYFLNEGSYDMNNSGITFYAPNKDHDKVNDIYMTQNKKGLGDTGQDMIEHDNNIYVVVYGSSLLVKLNSACVEQNRLAFSESDGQPRYITEGGGKLYVTLYSGKVAKIDPKELKIEGYVTVGSNPEKIIENDGFLYVVNSGWGSGKTLSVINVAEFKLTKTIEIATNPFKVFESEDQIFVLAYGASYPDPYTYPVQKVDIATGNTTIIANATNMCEHNGTIYFVYSETDWNTYQSTNTFFSYNVKTGALNNNSFLTDMPSELASATINMMVVNPENGELYIGTSDYTTNGDIYRFNANKKFVEKFESGGISPTAAVFF
jgi:hypothetical protein